MKMVVAEIGNVGLSNTDLLIQKNEIIEYNIAKRKNDQINNPISLIEGIGEGHFFDNVKFDFSGFKFWLKCQKDYLYCSSIL